MSRSLVDALKGPVPEATSSDARADAGRSPSRRGRKAVTIYLDAAAHRQLRLLAAEQDRSGQELVVEAINDLFGKHGKARIAD